MDSDPQAPSQSFHPLTIREREILVLLSQGLSDNQIAERLFIARTTVKWFNRQIFNKVGAQNRAEAVQFARSMGLLSAGGPQAAPPHNLPADLTPFVGRARELAEISRWLRKPTLRLITILAPGGMGKTRLALQAAEMELDRYADGVCFVPLASLRSSDLLISALAEALGLQFLPGGHSIKKQLFDALHHKHLLLVLDNFEHLLDDVPLVSELLSAAPQVQVLITSREKLNLTGELVYPLTGLGVPDSATETDLSNSDAVQLFIACAQRANPHFEAKDTPNLRRICHLVQGMPLALELAAAWSGSLTPAEIVDEVVRSADFLQTSLSDVPERLRSVHIVFEAAWARLSDEAQQIFQRLAVFHGGCTREAVVAVTGATVRDLALLVDKALLWRNPQTERYEIHELLRQYAAEQLKKAGKFTVIAKAHHRYYATLAAKWGAAILNDQQLVGVAMLDADADNVRQALAHATTLATPDALEPFTDLWLYYDLRGRWDEGIKAFTAAMHTLEPNDSVALAKLLTGCRILGERFDKREQMDAMGKRGYEMTLRLGHQRALPLAMVTYANELMDTEDTPQRAEALAFYAKALALAEEVRYPLMAAIAIFRLAQESDRAGDAEEALAKFQSAYARSAQINNLWAMCFCLDNLALFAVSAADLDQADRLYHQNLDVARTIRFQFFEFVALQGLSLIAWQRRDWHAAYHHSLEAMKLLFETGRLDGNAFFIQLLLALSALMRTDLDAAFQHLQQALNLREQEDIHRIFNQCEIVAGGYFAHSGEYRRAVLLLSHGVDGLPRLGLHPVEVKVFSDLCREFLDECRAVLPPDAFDAMVKQGKTLSHDAVITELAIFL